MSNSKRMERRAILSFVILCLFLVMLVGYWSRRAPEGSTEPKQRLSVATERLNFGQQEPKADFLWTLPISNTTAETIRILGFDQSCLCTEVTPKTLEIEPGATESIDVRLDLSPRNDSELSSPFREFAATIKPICQDGRLQEPWQLRGIIVNPFRLDPPYLDYGESLVYGAGFPIREVRVSVDTRLSKLTAKCVPPLGKVEAMPESDREFRIRLALNAELPPGHHQLRIELHGTAKDGSNDLIGGINVLAKVVEDIKPYPPVLLFGALRIGEMAQGEVVLQSRTGSDFEVVEVDTSEIQNLEVSSQFEENASSTFVFRRRSDAIGTHIDKVYFRVKTALDSQLTTVPVTLFHTCIKDSSDTQRGQQ